MTTTMDGKFALIADVTDRYEGTVPDADKLRISLRIADVEADLMGVVASLRKPIADIETDNEIVGDPGRLERVKVLVCNKVLEMYRNPDGASQTSQTMEGDSSSRSYWRDQNRGTIDFTDAELDKVKLRRRRRKIYTLPVAPWNPPCC